MTSVQTQVWGQADPRTVHTSYWLEAARQLPRENALDMLRAAWRTARDARAEGKLQPESYRLAADAQQAIEQAAAVLRVEPSVVAGQAIQGINRPRIPSVSDWGRVRDLQRQLPELPHAYYAVELADGVLHFFRVDKPQEGAWRGKTFVKEQASDALYPVKQAGRLTAILEAIVADPKAAMLRYGKEIGRCGHCHRTLTNEESRAYGIGPICRGNMGW